MARAFLDAVGASDGTFCAEGLLRAADAVGDRLNLDPASLFEWLSAMSQGIRSCGGAASGDKTMVDAWMAAVDAALAVPLCATGGLRLE